MAKIINITDKLSSEKPKIIIGENEFEVNNSMMTVMKFEELLNDSTTEAFKKAITLSLGEDAVDKLNFEELSVENFKIVTVAILAAMQGIDYEEAEKRFQQF